MAKSKYYKCVSLECDLSEWSLYNHEVKKFNIGSIYLGIEAVLVGTDSIYVEGLHYPPNMFEEVVDKKELEVLRLLYE